jgi:hypothetical protein
MPAMALEGIAPLSADLDWLFGWFVGIVLDGSEVVEVLGEDAVKATTRFAEGASRRPSPTLGVGKWLAGTPIEACCRTVPVEGSSP